MANRNWANSRIYTGHVMPVLLDISVPIGATGAVGTIKGPYIKAVTRLNVGLYQIQMSDNFNKFYNATATFQSPATGSATDPHTLTVGQPYQISTVGNTDWTTAGVPTGVTPAIGVGFVLAAQPATGTGRAKLVTESGIAKVEIVGNSNLTNAPIASNGSGAQGAIILIQTLQAQMPSATTQGTAIQYALTDPTSGSTLLLKVLLGNSSVTIGGE